MLLWHIISVGFWGFTWWSQNILRMKFRRAYLLWSWQLATVGGIQPGKIYEDTVLAVVQELYLPTVLPVHHMEIFTILQPKQTGNYWNCLYKAVYRQNWSADNLLSTVVGQQWRKWIEAAVLEWKKIQGCIPLHETYNVDTQEKSDPRNTYRFLLIHVKLSCFWVSGTVWTFSGTICVDPQWDNSSYEDLVEIARSKFKEAVGASELPDAIKYLSVHCNI